MATTIATVVSLEGQAWAKSANGTLRVLKVGDSLAPDEVVVTATGAHIELDFGDGHPVTLAGGQEVLMGRDLWTDLASDEQDAAVQDASVQEALTVLNSGGDLTTALEEAAAGILGGSGGDGHSFVQLTRVLEQVSSETFNFSAANVANTVVAATDSLTENHAPLVTAQIFTTDEDNVLQGQIVATDIENDALSYGIITQPTNGTITLDVATGVFVYSPKANYNGVDTVEISVSDSHGNVTSSALTFTINAINDAPVSGNQVLVTAEDTALIGRVAATDVEGDVLNYSLTSVASHGEVLVNPTTGEFVYTPNADYNGNDSFTVAVSDGQGGVVTSIVVVAVTAVNDLPVTNNQAVTTGEYVSLDGKVIATDVDGDALTYALSGSATHGLVEVNTTTGEFVYTPDNSYNGNDSFVVSVADGHGGTVASTISVVVTPIDYASIVNNGSGSVIEDIQPVATGKLTAIDLDNPSLAFVPTTRVGGNGSLELLSDGSWTYSLDSRSNALSAGELSAETFVVKLTDGSLARISIDITGTNDAPVSVDQTVFATEDTPQLGKVFVSDVDRDALNFTLATTPAHGSVTLNAKTGSFIYTPEANYNGKDNFEVTVMDGHGGTTTSTMTVQVVAVNDAPIANPDNLTAIEDTPVTYTAAQLVGNDTDIDLSSLSILSVTSGVGGTAVLNGDGTVTFTPNANFNGTADFTYTATDGALSSNTATVSIAVAPVNDAPVAVNDNLAATEDTSVTYAATKLVGNDTDVDLNTLSIASVSSGTGGVAVLNGDGTVTFTPNANFNGVADFTYQVTDGLLISNAATVSVAVAAVNDAPIAVADSLIATEDAPVIYTASQLLGNDTDVDLNTLSISRVTSGTGGTTVLNGDGTVTFTPNANFNGAAKFTYTVTDGTVTSNTAAVSVAVGAVNDAPVAVSDSLVATEDKSVTYTKAQLLGNDKDVELSPLSIASVISGMGGTAVLNGNGTVTFTPFKDFNGAANFTYMAADGDLMSNSATVSVAVAPVNDAPVAVNDSLAAIEDTPITYSAAQLLSNDTDVDSSTLSIATVASGVGGVAVLNVDGTVTFTPHANFNGIAKFTYTITDDLLTSNTATVNVAVAPVNDAPIANPDNLTAIEDTPVTYTAAQLVGNDTDIDLSSLSILSVTSGVGGTVVLNGDGTVTFTPNANFNGIADFTYKATDGALNSNTTTVSIVVAPVNDAPIAVNDNLAATEDTPVTYAATKLVGNDTDVDLNTLSIASVSSGTGGVAVLNGDGTVTFTPNANFNGVADFTYQVTDGLLISNAATVSVAVAAVNDAPIAVADSLIATEDTPVIYTASQLLGNDTDVDLNTLSISRVTSGTGGTAVLNGDGTVTFTPNANFNGAAKFTYTVTDGTVTSNTAAVSVAVGAVNDAPVAVSDSLVATEDKSVTYTKAQLLGNDKDVELSPLSIASVTSGMGGTAVLNGNGTVTFTPFKDFNGAANFTYTATDGALMSNSATVSVAVAPVNDAPVAVNDSLTAAANRSVTYTAAQLLGNDTDVDANTLTIASVTNGTNGTVALNGDGTVTFTPTANFTGTANFKYTITDDAAISNSATVSVLVTPAPIAVDDNLTATEDTPVTYIASELLGNDTSVNLNPLSIASVTSGVGGSTVLKNDGTLAFTPDANFSGTANFTYTVTDGLQTSNIATVSIAVAPVNDAPVAVNDSVKATEGKSVTYNKGTLLGNDTDVDLNTLSISSVISGTGGIAKLNPDGSVTFTPNDYFNGAADFTYVATDGFLKSNTATVNVAVAAVNDAPVAVNDSLKAIEDTPITYSAAQLLGNDTDVDSSTLSISSVTSGVGGKAVKNGDGSVSFTPDADFSGVADFTYKITDGKLTSNSATVSVDVSNVNDAPVAVNDSLAAIEGSPVTYTAAQLLGNDTDVDSGSLSITSVTSGAGGTAVLNPDGTVTFTPTANFSGAADFTYSISDGSLSTSATVAVTVTPVNDAPVASNDSVTTVEDTPLDNILVLGNDTDPDGDSLTVTGATALHGSVSINPDGTLKYTPTGNYTGADTISYSISDGSLSTSATVVVTVTPVNDAPVASNDSAVTTAEDTPLDNILVLGNDSDPDGDSLTVTGATALHGSVSINPDGTLKYTPTGNYTGADTISYTISDGSLSSSATVAVTVTPVNDAPVASNDSAVTTAEDTPLDNIVVLTNDTDPDGDSLTVTLATALHGSVSINPDGTLKYTPTANYTGVDTISYTISDGSLSTSATVAVTITPVNDAPVASNDSAVTTAEETPLDNIAVLTNDTDPDGDSLTVTLASALHGTVSINPDGTLKYTPTANYTGVDTISYTISDGSLSTSATVAVTVTPVNDAPVASNDSVTTAEETPLDNIAVLTNDTDPDGDSLTVTLASALHGTVSINPDGTLKYTPTANYTGVDTISYTISDGSLSSSATVAVTVTPVNDAPVATSDSVTTAEDTPLDNIAVLTNDTDPDGDSLTVTGATALHGSVSINPDGTLKYTPTGNYTGADTISYTISDGSLSTSATVAVTITPVNDAPVASNDSVTTAEETPLDNIAVLTNDTDPDSDSLTVTLASALHGTVSINPDGTLKYTPTANYTGVDTISYTISDGSLSTSATVAVTVTPVNDAPVATSDSVTTAEETPLDNIAVLTNDTDPDGDSLTVTGATALHGSVSINPDGTLKYTPTANYTGADTISYTISDGSLSTSATVAVTITPVNDAPVASNDSVTTAEETPLDNIAVLTNDTDPDGDSLTVTLASALHGTVSINPDGTLKYTPTANYTGVDTISYTISDGSLSTSATVAVTITPVNDAPVASNDSVTTAEETPLDNIAVLTNDTDPDGDSLTVTLASALHGTVSINPDGTLKYTPTGNYTGADTISYTISDGSLSSSATVAVTVTPVNDAPVATSDSVTTAEDTPLDNIAVLTNDTDPDGDSLTVTGATALHGSVSINPDGTLKYTPTGNYTGADTISYTISDGSLSTSATVAVTVTPVNDAPVATSDSVTTAEETPLDNIAVLTNDTDPDGDSLTVTGATALHGSVSINPDGTLKYTPTANYTGADTISYTISDGSLSTSATVAVTITPVNDAPVASNDSVTTAEETPLDNIAVLTNDTDPDGDSLTVTLASALHGTVSINPDGTLKYTPTTNYTGVDTISYTISDGSLSTSATVAVTITPVNDAPVASNDSVTTAEETPLDNIAVLTNDTDPDSDSLTVTGASALHGTVSINPDGTLKYTPTGNYTGADTISYTISDGSLSSSATVAVTVTPVNDAPVASNDSTVTTAEDTPLDNIAVLTNDTDPDGDSLTVTLASALHGTVSINPDGTLKYTPTANYTGVDTISYTISDGSLSSSATVAVTVTPVNDAPVATSDSVTTAEDTPLDNIAVLTNDTDPDGDSLTVTGATALHGSVSINPDGTLKYTPTGNYTGADTISYTISDGSLSTSATVAVTITPVNDAPVASNDSVTTAEETPLDNIAVLTNDTDPDSDSLTVTLASALHGTVSINPDGTLKYTPTANYTGVDTISYTISDGSLSTSATVAVTVTPVNDAPVATSDSVTTAEETPLDNIAVLTNDTDPDGDSLTVTGATALHGSVSINPDGTLKYTPTANYTGADTISYTISDGSLSTSATVAVTITPVNDAPVASNDSVTTAEETPLDNIAVLTNDTDPDGDSLTVTLASALHGTVSINPDGTLKYTPTANYTGVDTISYTISDGSLSSSATVAVTVTPVADTPTLNVIVDVNSGVTTVPVVLPASVGLKSDNFVAIAAVDPSNANNLSTVESGVESTTPTSTATITDVQYATIGIDDAYHIQGYIFLEAGHSYQLQGSRDDTLLVKIGGTTVYNVGYNAWGDLYTGDSDSGLLNITPVPLTITQSGYYSVEVVMYNGDGPGNLNLNLSVDGQAAVDLSTANFNLYTDSATLISSGTTGTFVSNGDGGFYPLANAGAHYSYFSLQVSAALTDTDGSESLTVNAAGIPVGTTLTDGTHIFIASAGLDSTDVSNWNLSELTVIPATGQTTSFDVTFTATATDGASTHSSVQVVTLNPSDNGTTNTAGTSGNDNLTGLSGADSLFGLDGNDTLLGNGGGDLLVGGAGGDVMSGAIGADTFRWNFGDQGTVSAPSVDVVTNFTTAQGDSLNLSDLLQNETGVDLTHYLHFEVSGTDTTISISTAGAFDGSNYATATDQTIVLNNLNLTGTDTAIIDQLKNNGNLITD